MTLRRAFETMATKAMAPRGPRPLPTHPSSAPMSQLVVALCVAAAAILLASLFVTWWTVEDWEREKTLVFRGYSGYPLLVIGFAGLLIAVTITGAGTGRREWAPLVVCMSWGLLLFGWFSSSGETIDSDATGSVGVGLRVGTVAIVLATLAFLIAARLRTVDDRRRAAAVPPAPNTKEASR